MGLLTPRLFLTWLLAQTGNRSRDRGVVGRTRQWRGKRGRRRLSGDARDGDGAGLCNFGRRASSLNCRLFHVIRTTREC